VERGDYIGRPKVFQTTGSVAMTLNWRVDRIRDTEVVLTRQDPQELGRPPLSRIISMHEEIAAR
jgi:type IV pilus assembly protein PilP